MHQNALVSIITPSYNSALFIEETMESVLGQTYENWEMIIIDDCSTDKSLEIIQKYSSQDNRIKFFINKENLGVARSRNNAIEVSKGDYIAFLDSDDCWYPTKLEKQILLMQRNNVLLSYSAYNIMNESSVVVGNFPVKEKITYKDVLKTSIIGTLTMIYNAKELDKWYFKDIGHEDYAMKLEILKKVKFAQGIQEPLASYRIVKESLSSNKFKAAIWQWKIYRNIERISLLQSMYYFLHYIYHGYTKYKKLK